MKDRTFLKSKGLQFREVNDGPKVGLIIDNFPVKPDEKFDCEASSLLIILPSGYPDVPPDMFYFDPPIKLKASNGYPAQADLIEAHFQTNWQRWSRHAPTSDWRSGKDGIQSYLQRVVTALNITT